DPSGFRSQEAQLTDRIERVRLGNEDDVEAGLFEFGDLRCGLREAAAVVQTHSDAHTSPSLLPCTRGGRALSTWSEHYRRQLGPGRTTMTGQCASRMSALLVDPSRRPVNPPRPRLPTTTS